jgi:hypothetical protein
VTPKVVPFEYLSNRARRSVANNAAIFMQLLSQIKAEYLALKMAAVGEQIMPRLAEPRDANTAGGRMENWLSRTNSRRYYSVRQHGGSCGWFVDFLDDGFHSLVE